MKSIKVKPVESMKIELIDRTYICTFNMLSTAYMQEELGKLGDTKLTDISPAKMCTLILYAGIKTNEEDFTLEEAANLVVNMGPAAYGDILGLYNEAMFDSMQEKDQNVAKN